MKTIKITVSKAGPNKGDKRIIVGSLETICPDLSDFGINAVTEVNDDGETVYSDAKCQWLQEAVETSVETWIKSALEPQTISFKAGFVAPTSLDNIFRPTKLPRGAGIRIRSAFNTAFGNFVAGLKKSDNLKNTLIALCGMSEDKFRFGADESRKRIFSSYLGQFFTVCSDEDKTRFEKIFTDFATLCADGTEELLDA